MIIKTLNIQNFRNYTFLNLELNDKINIIYGENGQGKTNLLESIYLLGFTTSHRTFTSDNLIKSGEETAIVKGKLIKDLPYNLEIDLSKTKKQIKIDDKIITKNTDYIEKMNVIIFSSEDLNLIKGSPGERRKYFNLELSQLSINYYSALNDFNKLLKIRNEYLKELNQNIPIDLSYFHILTDYLVNKSIFIYQMRNKFVEKLNKICPPIYEEITGLKGFNIKYVPSIELENFDKENIKRVLEDAYNNHLEKEIRLKSTLYGPHRDDFTFNLEDNNLKEFGSQGQQKMAVIALKLSEIEIFQDFKHTSPIILLDDVFSDLDNKKKNNLLKHIDKDMQVIITTTDLDSIDKELLTKAKLIHIDNGQIKEIEVEKWTKIMNTMMYPIFKF